VSDRELKVREREREAERAARQEARRYLLEARGQVERAIAEIRAKAAEQADGFDDTARAVRRSIEEAASAQQAAVESVEQRGARDKARAESKKRDSTPPGAGPLRPAARPPVVQPLAEGESVLVGTLGDKVGRIAQLRGTDARVVVGSLTLTVPVSTLSRTTAAPAPMVRVSLAGDIAEVEPVREIDVRGLRADEIGDQVLQALDAAVRNDLRELRIIHGKGTGALRARVGEMLKKDTRVTGFRLGAWNEGGAGVTVAELG
jgi:DNA mismatch repair protein MutS2